MHNADLLVFPGFPLVAENLHDNASKINMLKLSMDELRARTDMGTEPIRTLLHTYKDRFKKQAAELHTFRADHEN